MLKKDRQISLMSGFTLIEVILLIALLGVLFHFVLPNLKIFRSNYLLKTAARDFFSNIQKAKYLAALKNNFCTVTFNQYIIADNKKYDYCIFIDKNRDLEYNHKEQIIVKKLFSDYTYVIFDSDKGGGDGLTFTLNDDKLPSIAFKPSGVPVSNKGSFAQGTVYLKNNYNSTKRIIISQAGNVRIE